MKQNGMHMGYLMVILTASQSYREIIMVLERQNVGNNMQLYIIFVHFVDECVIITKDQCQLSPESGNGFRARANAGIVIASIILLCVIYINN